MLFKNIVHFDILKWRFSVNKLLFRLHDSQPASWWFSTSRYSALVKSLMGLVDLVDGHVSCWACPNENAILIEESWKAGRQCLVSTMQSYSFTLQHMSRALQDYWNN